MKKFLLAVMFVIGIILVAFAFAVLAQGKITMGILVLGNAAWTLRESFLIKIKRI